MKRTETFLLLTLVTAFAGCNPLSDESRQAEHPDQSAFSREEHAGHQEHDESHGEHQSSDDHGGEHAGDGGESHGEDKREVHLSQTQRNRLDVRIGRAKSGSAMAVVTAPATVAFVADKVAKVGPRLEAKVVQVTKDLGSLVQAGEVVAVLDSVELGRAKSKYLVAQARFNAAFAEYKRDQKLTEQQIISQAHLLEGKAAYQQARAQRDASRAELKLYGLSDRDIQNISANGKQPLSRYNLIAPIDGTIQRRDLAPGQTVSAQQSPIHIVNSNEMWVFIEAYEQDLTRLEPGLPVSVAVRALPEQVFEGSTDWISSELDEQARTVRVRATLTNPHGQLRAGMFGTARIQTKSEATFALVPVDAVQTIGDQDVLFVPGEETNAFKAVDVVTGEESGGQIEIRRGLQPDDEFVAVGAFDLNSALTAGSRSAAHSH